jgi:hypothetical protein
MVARIVLGVAVLNLLFLLTELSFNVIGAGLPLD